MTAEHRPDGGIILGVATHKGTFRVMLNGREARRLAAAARASQQAAKDSSGIVFTTPRAKPLIQRWVKPAAADQDVALTPS